MMEFKFDPTQQYQQGTIAPVVGVLALCSSQGVEWRVLDSGRICREVGRDKK
jgi:hypothetical protein